MMPEPTDLTPADTSSRSRRARSGTADAVRPVDDVVVPVAPSDAEIGALRARAGSFDAVVVGTIEGHRQPAQAALVRAIAGTGTPTVAVAMRTPWDALVYPAGVPAIATYRSCQTHSTRSRARSQARSVSRAAFPSPWRLRPDDPPRRDPRTARGGGAVPGGPGRQRRGDRRVAARDPAAARRHRRPRDVRPRRDLCPVRARRPAPAHGRARHAVDRLGLRCGAGPPRRARHRHQPVGGVAGHRRGHRRGRAQGAPTIAITNDPIRRCAAADRTIALGAGPERAIAATKTYTAELLAVALLSAALADDPADRAAVAAVPDALARVLDLEPEIERIAPTRRPRPVRRHRPRVRVRDRPRVGTQAQGAGACLRRSLLLGRFPARTADPRRAGVPVLAVVRSGRPARTSSRSSADSARARRRSDDLSDTPRRSTSRRGPSDCRAGLPNGSVRSSRSSPGSSTRSTSRAPAASIPNARATSTR